MNQCHLRFRNVERSFPDELFLSTKTVDSCEEIVKRTLSVRDLLQLGKSAHDHLRFSVGRLESLDLLMVARLKMRNLVVGFVVTAGISDCIVCIYAGTFGAEVVM
jgi:hypothetical protein